MNRVNLWSSMVVDVRRFLRFLGVREREFEHPRVLNVFVNLMKSESVSVSVLLCRLFVLSVLCCAVR